MSNAASRVPPNNPEAEQSVLGGILLDNQMYARLEDVIEPDDFYRPANAKIFRSMRELSVRNEPIDIVTLTVKMKEMGVYEECGGAAYLADILERVPTAINAEYHAKLVADQAVKRRLVSACTELGQRGMEPGEQTEELLDHAEKTIFGLTSTRKTKSVVHLRDIIKPAFHELEYRFAHRGELTGVPSGFDGLDKQTYGFQKSDLIIVACRPSVGKTSFSLGVARNAATKGKKLPVLFYSLEMSKEQIVTRLLAAEAKVDSTKIRSGELADQDWQKLTRAAGVLTDAPLFIDDTPSLSVLEMRAKARRLKSQCGDLGLIIVDYLQIMGTPKGSENREKAISEISRSLKALAKELQVPVLALSQLNRSIESRQEKRPMMSDIRESGAIEQDADVIIFIHRENTEASTREASPATLIVGKNRNGPREDVSVVWLGQYTSFENLAAPPQ